MLKKSRGPNFSNNEKELVVHLVTKHKDVVENKKTDAVTTAMKTEGWRKLTEEFNSMSTFCARNTDQLKTCWDNIKRNTRKHKAATKKQVLRTGGGKPDIPPPGPLQGQVEILLGPTLDGLDNPFDSDIHFLGEGSLGDVLGGGLSNNVETIQVIETADDNAAADAVGSSSQMSEPADEKKLWNSWTPTALKTKVATTLSVDRADNPSTSTWLRRRRPKTSLQDKVLQSKLDLVEIMKKTAETDAKIKEEQLKQEIIKTAKLQAELEKLKDSETE